MYKKNPVGIELFSHVRLRANGRNNSEHCCANNVGSCCVRVGSGLQTDATTPNKFGTYRVCSFRRIQKRIFDPRFARFRGRKEREIRNWICNLGNLSPTRAICMTASQEMTCFLLFDKLCDYTVQNLVVGSSNSDDGTYKTDQKRSALKLKII